MPVALVKSIPCGVYADGFGFHVLVTRDSGHGGRFGRYFANGCCGKVHELVCLVEFGVVEVVCVVEDGRLEDFYVFDGVCVDKVGVDGESEEPADDQVVVFEFGVFFILLIGLQWTSHL